MESLELLKQGFAFLGSPVSWGVLLLAVVWGIIFGAVPGLGSSLAMLTVLPLILAVPPTLGVAALAAIYCGGTFGGAFSAILLNIPGATENICTTFDGYPMARKGMAGKALQASVMSSAFGGILSALAFIFLCPLLGTFALRFSDADYFGIMVMGILFIAISASGDWVKGLLSGLLGLLVGTIGLAPSSALPRFSFDMVSLEGGFSFLVFMIGTYGIAEILARFKEETTGQAHVMEDYRDSRYSLREALGQKFNMLRSAVLGIIVGIVPGVGAGLAAFLGYFAAKGMAKNPGEFGKGNLDGVVAPETSNNAATGGALIPLFSLGIPGGVAPAILLAVLLFKGIQPGPLIFTKQASLVGSIMVALLLANIFVLFVGRYGALLFTNILKVKFAYIATAIAIFCLIGAYSFRHIMFDIYCIVGAGLLGYYWKKHGFPIPPFLYGMVLGPLAEYRLLNALTIYKGDMIGVLTSPYGMVAIIFGLLLVISVIISSTRATSREKPTERVPSRMSLVSPFLYFAAIVVFISLWNLTNSWPEAGRPATWPRLILGGLIILTMVRMITWFLSYKRAKKLGGSISWVSVRSYFLPDGLCIFLPLVIIASYVVLQGIVGFIILTVVFSVAFLYISGVRHPLKIAIFTLGMLAVISFLFIGFLHATYPVGTGLFSHFHYWLYDVLFDILG